MGIDLVDLPSLENSDTLEIITKENKDFLII